jgi:CHAT domain-containing protein
MVEYFVTAPCATLGQGAEDYTEQALIAVTAGGGQPAAYHYLGRYDCIETAVSDYLNEFELQASLYSSTLPSRGLLKRDNRRLLELSRHIRKLILDPLGIDLAQTSNLIICPDGCLNKVPFEAIAAESPDNTDVFMGELVGIQYARSTTDLTSHVARQPVPEKLRQSNQPTATTFVLTNPHGEAAHETTLFQSRPSTLSTDIGVAHFADIQVTNTLGNIDNFPTDLKDIHWIHGDKATEDRLLEMQDVPYCIIAAHGIHNPASTTHDLPFGDSAMLLLEGHCEEQPRPSALNNDGLATAYEVSALDLSDTRLVVLACCSSAMGQQKVGMGSASMRLAFQLAGAHNVVSARWEIPTNQSVDQIRRFLGVIETEAPIGQTFSAAQRDYIHDLRGQLGVAHPYYWAGLHCYVSYSSN